jgi:hypothetical protein
VRDLLQVPAQTDSAAAFAGAVEACGAELRAMRVPREEFDQGVRERLGALARADFGDKEFALR